MSMFLWRIVRAIKEKMIQLESESVVWVESFIFVPKTINLIELTFCSLPLLNHKLQKVM